MEICTCKECRRLFNYLSGVQLCTDCRRKQEEKFQEVKRYLRENPGASLEQLSESCGVKGGYVTQWVREGRLELSDCAEADIRCRRCGTTIPGGRLCGRCKRDFLYEWNELEDKNQKPQPTDDTGDTKPRMRFKRR